MKIYNYFNLIFLKALSELNFVKGFYFYNIIWITLYPLIQIIIDFFIFSNIFSAKLGYNDDRSYSYGLYISCGIIFWKLFLDLVNKTSSIYYDNSNEIKKTNLPISVMSLSIITGCLIEFILIFCIFIIFQIIYLNYFSFYIFHIFYTLILFIIFSISIGFLFAPLTLFLKGSNQLVLIFNQLLFWSAPIVYPISIIPKNLQIIISYNPITMFINNFHNALIFEQVPRFLDCIGIIIYTLVFCIISYLVNKRLYNGILDKI